MNTEEELQYTKLYFNYWIDRWVKQILYEDSYIEFEDAPIYSFEQYMTSAELINTLKNNNG